MIDLGILLYQQFDEYNAMNMFYLVKPEVPGGMGAKTVYDKSIIPWRIEKVHVVFEGWLGGNLLKVSPCFFVTEQLKNEMESHF